MRPSTSSRRRPCSRTACGSPEGAGGARTCACAEARWPASSRCTRPSAARRTSSRRPGATASEVLRRPSNSARRRPNCSSTATCCSFSRDSTLSRADSNLPNQGGGPAGIVRSKVCTCSSTLRQPCSCEPRPCSRCSTRDAACRTLSASSSSWLSCSRCSASTSTCWARHWACVSLKALPNCARTSRSASAASPAARSPMTLLSMRRSWAAPFASQAATRASRPWRPTWQRAPTCSSCRSMSCLSASLRRWSPATSTDTRSASWLSFMSPPPPPPPPWWLAMAQGSAMGTDGPKLTSCRW
mmetsp:Transcript_161311/g.517868  ORF Transcript_161311/g.517868 Transcript_161311/m.517868 type:complete len:300 (-) Transcript_161311:182-1081(-)